MTVTVRLFATARDVIGFDSRKFEVMDSNIAAVRKTLEEQFPSAKGVLASSRFAVNMDYATDASVLHEGDEVAVIPPVSGG